jgi:hypothetical protein
MMSPAPTVDAAPACTNVCTIAATKCTGGDVQTCVMMPSGCTEWSTPAMCPAPQTCAAGKTKCECPTGASTCAKEGDQKCGAGKGVVTCEKSGACLAWSSQETACATAKSCKTSSGNASCQCDVACTGGTCGVPVFNFEDKTLQGAYVSEGQDNVVRAPAAKQFSGTTAMGIDIEEKTPFGQIVSVRFPFCTGAETRNVAGKKASMRFYLAGPALPGTHSVKVQLERNGADIAYQELAVGSWQSVMFTVPADADMGTMAGQFEVEISQNTTTPWVGTIWIDDLRVE